MDAIERDEIRKTIEKRKIKYLVHFTPLDNLDSILEKGLYSYRHIIESKDGVCCDKLRIDGRKNGICLSISYPNDIMFYSYRKKYQYDWAVILLDINLILEIEDREIMFFQTNSANKKFHDVNNESLGTADAFNKLFADEVENIIDGVLKRENLLLDKYPTDVQAEVMITEFIESKYIKKVFINKNEEYLIKNYKSKYPDVVVCHCCENEAPFIKRKYHNQSF